MLFEIIRPLYYQAVFDEKRETYEIKCRIFEVRVTSFSAPIYVLDRKNIIHSRVRQFVIKNILPQDISQLFSKEEKEYVLSRIHDVRVNDWQSLLKYMFETDYSFNETLLQRFVKIDSDNIMVTSEWKTLVDNILSYNAEKDSSLLNVFKATLPRGFIMRFCPHTILVTPPNCGKTEFYDKVGKRVDKLTKQTLLGSVRWVDEKSSGLFHEQYYPLIVEQIESQQVENLMGFLLSFLELGHGLVSGGGAEMEVKGACSFIITANPISLTEKKVSTLDNIIQMLSKNTLALGRRFGILAYGNYLPVKAREYNDVEHRNLIDIYRSMEERATPTLETIWNDERIKKYCYTPIEYDSEIRKKIEEIESESLRGFLYTFIKHSFAHTRGGSVNMAIVDLLPKIVFHEIYKMLDYDKLVEEIILTSSFYLEHLKKINGDSIIYVCSR